MDSKDITIPDDLKQVVIKSEEDLIKIFGTPRDSASDQFSLLAVIDYLNGSTKHQRDDDV